MSKDCTFAEHIVRARGKRTQFTSVSLDDKKIELFGPVCYRVLRDELDGGGHGLVEHKELMESLLRSARSSDKAERVRAIRAQLYARRRLEGLVDWSFDISGLERKELITWAFGRIQKYFSKVQSWTSCLAAEIASTIVDKAL